MAITIADFDIFTKPDPSFRCAIINNMGEINETRPSGEPWQNCQASLLGFLLTNQELMSGHAAATRIFFGLDTVLFNRRHETHTSLAGSWRPDMPALAEGLLNEGFALSVLAHASRQYVNAALSAYEQQFKNCPNQIFDTVFTLTDYSKVCDRGEVFPVLDKETLKQEGKRSIFVDAFLSSLILPPDTRYVCVPEHLHYSTQQGPVFYNTLDG